MTKKKPDYTQFMKSPAPLHMAPDSDREAAPPIRSSASKNRPSEDDIPWGEVIRDPDPSERPRSEVSPEPVSKARAAASRTDGVVSYQPSMSAREKALARSAPDTTETAVHGSDSQDLTAALDDFAPRGYPPVAMMAIGLATVLLLLFLTGRS